MMPHLPLTIVRHVKNGMASEFKSILNIHAMVKHGEALAANLAVACGVDGLAITPAANWLPEPLNDPET